MNFLELKVSYIAEYRSKFNFDLYLYDKQRSLRFFALKSNQDLTESKFEEIKELCLKGLVIQFKDDNLDFFKKLGHRDDIVRDNQKKTELEKLEKNNITKKAKLEEFDFKETLKKSVDEENFDDIIERARIEISYFSIRESQLQSNLIAFISKTLTRDSSLTRGAAFCYFFCKRLGVRKEFDLLEILTAYLLKDIGLTQLTINDMSSEDYAKHPALSNLILSRANIKISDNVSRMIIESHERYDGLGFPVGKKENHIHFGSKIVNLCDYIFQNTYKTEPKINFYTCLKSISNGKALNNEVRKYPTDFIDTLKTLT